MTWLLGKLSGVFGPYILGAFAVLLLALAAHIVWLHAITLRDLRAQIATLDLQRKTALADATLARADAAQCTVDIRAQNDAVQKTATDCKSKSDAAAVAAVRAANKPITPPAGKSAAEINQWLVSTLRPSSSP
jgi:hypothetical protein